MSAARQPQDQVMPQRYPGEEELREMLREALHEVSELEVRLFQTKTRVAYIKRRLRSLDIQTLAQQLGPLASQVAEEPSSSDEQDGQPAVGGNGHPVVGALAPPPARPARAVGRPRLVPGALVLPPNKCKACWNEERGKAPAVSHTRGADGMVCRLPDGRKKPRRAPEGDGGGGGAGAGDEGGAGAGDDQAVAAGDGGAAAGAEPQQGDGAGAPQNAALP